MVSIKRKQQEFTRHLRNQRKNLEFAELDVHFGEQ